MTDEIGMLAPATVTVSTHPHRYRFSFTSAFAHLFILCWGGGMNKINGSNQYSTIFSTCSKELNLACRTKILIFFLLTKILPVCCQCWTAAHAPCALSLNYRQVDIKNNTCQLACVKLQGCVLRGGFQWCPVEVREGSATFHAHTQQRGANP